MQDNHRSTSVLLSRTNVYQTLALLRVKQRKAGSGLKTRLILRTSVHMQEIALVLVLGHFVVAYIVVFEDCGWMMLFKEECGLTGTAVCMCL